MTPLKYLDNLSKKVVNNHLNDEGIIHLIAYFDVLRAFRECSFITEEEFWDCYEKHKRLSALFTDD